MSRPLLAATLATLLSVAGLLAVATPAQAAPPQVPLCYVVDSRLYTAACLTALIPVALTVDEVNCLLNTPPINWTPTCTTWSLGPIPIIDYAFCYYYTAPVNWASTCV
jgi:hypothetical protein